MQLVQLSFCCAVLCDKLYGGRARLTLEELRNMCRLKHLAADLPPTHVVLHRQALHANVLRIAHPVTGERLEFTAPLPADLESVLVLLRETHKLK